MATPNFADRTIWTGDNLDILRGMNSECVESYIVDTFQPLRDKRVPDASHLGVNVT